MKRLIKRCNIFGDKASNKVTRFIATWKYIIGINTIIFGWMYLNHILKRPFDPYPYILLNLFLSWIAANTPSLIMMTTTRQDNEDRIKANENMRIDKKTLKLSEVNYDKIDNLEKQVALLVDIIHDLVEEKKNKHE